MTTTIQEPVEDAINQHDDDEQQCHKNVHVGQNIAAIRRGRGISQEYVALKLGKSQQTVSKIELMEDVPEELLTQISMILGVTAEYIKNYDLERLITNNTQIINNGGRGHFLTDNPRYNESTQITNSLDVIKYIISENKHLHEKSLQEKDLTIKELKAEIRLLKAENKRLNGELQQSRIGNGKK